MNKKKINKLLKEQEASTSILDDEANDDVFEVSIDETGDEANGDETDIKTSARVSDEDSEELDKELDQSIEVIEGIDEEGNVKNPVEANLKPGDEVSIVGSEGLERKEVAVDNDTGELRTVESDSDSEKVSDEDSLTDEDLEIIQIVDDDDEEIDDEEIIGEDVYSDLDQSDEYKTKKYDDMESKYFDKDDTIDENLYSDFSQTNNYNYEEEERSEDKIIGENLYSDFSQTNNYNYEEDESGDSEEILEIIEIGDDDSEEIPLIDDEMTNLNDDESLIEEEITNLNDDDESLTEEEIEILDDDESLAEEETTNLNNDDDDDYDYDLIEEDLNITYRDEERDGDEERDEDGDEKSPEELEAAGFGDLVPEEEGQAEDTGEELEMEDDNETDEEAEQSSEKTLEEPEGVEMPEDDVNDLVTDLLDGDDELEYISSLNSKDINIESTSKEELKLLKENIKQLELDKHVLLKVNGVLNLMPEVNSETKNRLAESFEKCKTKRQVDGLYTKIVTAFKESKRPSLNSLIIEENKGYNSFAPTEKDSAVLTENIGKTVLTEEQKRKNMLMGLGNEEEYYK
jgi:hypothetical protein